MPRVGSQFAGYRIEGVLGRGGMSVVYRADNPRVGNEVALKVLAADLSEDDAFRERFVRESAVAASIAHPNIIPIYDAGEEQGLLYVVMRFVAGGDLKALIRRAGPLPLHRTADLITQVARGLSVAHQRGLIHRDIKPANVLIEHAGTDVETIDHAYLADFGLMKRTVSRSGLTNTGQFLGTVDYVAPEQIEGRTPDYRADIYSLGCVVYECLTGTVPYPRDAEVAVLWAHVQDPLPRVTDVRADLPLLVDEVVARAIAKRPEHRYSSVIDLAGELSEAVGTSRYSRGERAVVPDRRAVAPASEPTPREDMVAARPGSGALPETPRSAPAMPPRARTSLIVTGLMIALIAAVGFLGFKLLGGGSSNSGANTHTSGAPKTSTGSSMKGIQGAVPSQLWSQLGCNEDAKTMPPAVPGTTAPTSGGMVMSSATCNFQISGAIPVTLKLGLFDSSTNLTAAYDRNRAAAGVKRDSGPCGANSFDNESVWHHGGVHGIVAGRKFCYFSPNPQDAVIAWTLTMAMGSGMGRNMLAVATAPAANHESLLEWWRTYRHQVGEGA